MTVPSSSSGQDHLPSTSTPRLVSTSASISSASSSSFSRQPRKTIPSKETPQHSYDKMTTTSGEEIQQSSSYNVKDHPRCFSKDPLQVSPDKERSSASLHGKDLLKEPSHSPSDEQKQQDEEDLLKGIGETASLVLQDMKSWIASQIQTNLLPPTRSLTTCTPSHPSSSSRPSTRVDSSSVCPPAYQHASTEQLPGSCAQQESFRQVSQKTTHPSIFSGGTKLDPCSSSYMSSYPSFKKTEMKGNSSFLEASSHSRPQHLFQREGKHQHDQRLSLSSSYLHQRDEPLSEDWAFKPEGIFSSFLSLFDVEEDHPGASCQPSSISPPPRGFPGQPATASFLEPSSSSFRQRHYPLRNPGFSSSSSSFLHSQSRLGRCEDNSSFSQEKPYQPSFYHPQSISSSSSSSHLPPLSRQERPSQETSYPSYTNISSPPHLRQRLGTSSSSLSAAATSLHLSQSTPRSLLIPAVPLHPPSEKEGTSLTSRNSSFRETSMNRHGLTTTQSISTARDRDSSTHLLSRKASLHPFPDPSSSPSFVSPHLDVGGGAGGASMFLLSPESIEEPADGFVKPQTWLADMASPSTQQYAQRSHIELSLLKLQNIGKPISSSVISGPVKLHAPGFHMLRLRVPIIDVKKQFISIAFSVHISRSHLHVLQTLDQYERKARRYASSSSSSSSISPSTSIKQGRHIGRSEREEDRGPGSLQERTLSLSQSSSSVLSQGGREFFFLQEEEMKQVAVLKRHLKWHRRTDEDRKRDALVMTYRMDLPLSSLLLQTNQEMTSSWVILAEDRPIVGMSPEAFFTRQKIDADKASYQPRLLFSAKIVMSGVTEISPSSPSSSMDVTQSHSSSSLDTSEPRYVYTARYDDPIDICVANLLNANRDVLNEYTQIKRIASGEYVINSYPCRVSVKPDIAKKDHPASSACTFKMTLDEEKDTKKDLSSSSPPTSRHRHLDTVTTTGGEEGEEQQAIRSSSSSSCEEFKACLSLGEKEKNKTAGSGVSEPLILVEEDDGTRQPLLDYLQGSLDNIDWGSDYYKSLGEEACPSAIDMIDEDLLPPLHRTLVPWEAQIDRRAAMSLACHRAAVREQVAMELLSIQGRKLPRALHKKHISPVLLRFAPNSPPVYVTYTWSDEYTDVRLVTVQLQDIQRPVGPGLGSSYQEVPNQLGGGGGGEGGGSLQPCSLYDDLKPYYIPPQQYAHASQHHQLEMIRASSSCSSSTSYSPPYVMGTMRWPHIPQSTTTATTTTATTPTTSIEEKEAKADVYEVFLVHPHPMWLLFLSPS
ncbi:hypothetical protein CSUI_002702 [Cystoisospora suis]|uniref:Uncharacterized protein n=1 Tax=Cystoisospora suis TaxID=483139 RepID=A0A2C6L7R3_9APIC|nr:hypothetical protein CSUI_002702 [Cystoisospora suis]